jgi:phage tail-like protein
MKMARTMANDPIQQFRFKIEIGGVAFGARTVSGLEKEVEVAEYAEGGYPNIRKLPGRAKTGVISIERGAFKDKKVANYVNDALTKSNFRKTVVVIEQDRFGKGVRQWVCTEAWASKFTAPEKDATSSDVSVDKIELQYEDIRCDLL